jgi:hypothetical protein
MFIKQEENYANGAGLLRFFWPDKVDMPVILCRGRRI